MGKRLLTARTVHETNPGPPFRKFDPQTDLPSDLARRAYSIYQKIGLDGVRIHKSRFDMGGSHTTVTYPPLFALRPSSGSEVWTAERLGPLVDLYIHIAFCETRCTFCPYDADVPHGRTQDVEDYLGALKIELAAYAKRLGANGSKLNSIYIGGGTPTILSRAQLGALIDFVRSNYAPAEGLPFCIEGSPPTIMAPEGKEKLEMLRAKGVNRLSIGIQSFDDAVLANVARRYGGEVAHAAVKTAMGLFENVNIDLIQDLRGQTLESIQRDLDIIAELLPPSVTWYNQRATPDAADFRFIESRPQEYGDEMESHIARIMIFERTMELGYVREYGDKFVRGGKFKDSFKRARSSTITDMVGVGSSAYSHANGFFYRNVESAEAYIDLMNKRGSAIAHALPLSPEEVFAGLIVHGIKFGIDLKAVCEVVGEWRVAHFLRKHRINEKLRSLQEDGLISVEGSIIRLTEKGRLFENEICRLFYSPSVEKALSQRGCPAYVKWYFRIVHAASMLMLLYSIGEALLNQGSATADRKSEEICQPFSCGT
ncbi:MAG: coproporphyrinogen-III oxidase family protein [Candidatus Micrarchaeota archaeon]